MKKILKNFMSSVLTTIIGFSLAIGGMAYAYTAATDSGKLTAAMWNELMDAVTSSSGGSGAPALGTDSLNAQMSFALHSDSCSGTESFIKIKNSVLGICMEKTQRTAAHWEDARKICSDAGKRLPEPGEFKFACQNAAAYGLSDMTGDWEWSSNFAQPVHNGSYAGVGAAIAGGSGCHGANLGWVGYRTGVENSSPFRCVR